MVMKVVHLLLLLPGHYVPIIWILYAARIHKTPCVLWKAFQVVIRAAVCAAGG